jgi:hypothetical protein
MADPKLVCSLESGPVRNIYIVPNEKNEKKLFIALIIAFQIKQPINGTVSQKITPMLLYII